MGDEWLSDITSPTHNSIEEGSERNNRSTPLSYIEIFEKHFPYYLALGMTFDQYWNDDCELVKFYREADKIRQDRQNQMIWLQGMYVYDAIARLAPALNPSTKKGTKVKPYVEKPYPLSQESVEETHEEKERISISKGRQHMEMFAAKFNKQFEDRKEVTNGNDNRSSRTTSQ